MTLQQLKYVITVAEEGSISKAANKLYISQPSLTNQIHEIENEYDIKIFTRTNKGIIVSQDGEVFLGYARQVLEQSKLLDERYKSKAPKILFSISCQHYSFAVNAFVDLIKKYDSNYYDFSIRETKTYEIIDDVSKLKSEVGILYINDYNKNIILKLLEENNLEYNLLFRAKPHIFTSCHNPLAKKNSVSLEELKDYPYLSFEQGDNNSFYFSEEILSYVKKSKNIRVRDRATLFNLAIGLNGYTISSGVLDKDLNSGIIGIPLEVNDYMDIIIITHKNIVLSDMAKFYIESLHKYIEP
ncbi:MAG: LysR family transcriptional regulator [Acholeplasmatales bacterium]|nr:LysR family transcriptional regulator [Acholeplasmatales bacterium]